MKKIILLAFILNLFQNLNVNAQAPSWEWAKGYQPFIDYSWDGKICNDATGNVIVVALDPNYAIEPESIYMDKYDAMGNHIWSKVFGCFGAGNIPQSIVSDDSDNIYMTGWYEFPYNDTIWFGGTTIIANEGLFVVKFDSSGNAIWARGVESVSTNNHSISLTYGLGVDVDASGNVYATGCFTCDTLAIENDTVYKTPGSNYDFFVAKYNSSGHIQWLKSATGTKDDIGTGIKTDGVGNVFISGTFKSPTLNFGTAMLTNTSADTSQLFLSKYDTNGNLLWAHTADGIIDNSYSSLVEVTTDISGNAYIASVFTSPTITLGATILTHPGVFIAKYNAAGNVMWAKDAIGIGEFTYSINRAGECKGIASDLNSNIVITGFFNDTTITFGSTAIINQSNNRQNMFVVKYDTTGNVIWGTSAYANYVAGVGAEIYPCDISTDHSGNEYIIGLAAGNSIFGNDTIASGGIYYIAKLGSGFVGIKEITNQQSSITISPNPFTSTTTITFSEEQKNTTIKVMDVLGQTIQQLTTNNKQLTLDMSGYAKGVYFVRIEDEKKNVVMRKVLKQ